MGVHWKEWCWSWNSNTLATSCEELTHWKRLWCWEGLGTGEGDDREWDGWMASLIRWLWVWVNSRSWWWTGRPGVLQFMGSQRVKHDWATELNWTDIRKVRSSQVAQMINLPAMQETQKTWVLSLTGRSPGEGNGNLPKYSYLENPMDRGTWQATVHRATKESDMAEWKSTHTNKVRLWKEKNIFYFLEYSWFSMLCSLQQSESVIHIHISTLFLDSFPV